jgi:hypothetical protein
MSALILAAADNLPPIVEVSAFTVLTAEPRRISLKPVTSPRSLIRRARLLEPPSAEVLLALPRTPEECPILPRRKLREPDHLAVGIEADRVAPGTPNVPRFRTVNCCVAAPAAAGGGMDGTAERVGSSQAGGRTGHSRRTGLPLGSSWSASTLEGVLGYRTTSISAQQTSSRRALIRI